MDNRIYYGDALETGRGYIRIDLHKEYVDMAEKQLEQLELS